MSAVDYTTPVIKRAGDVRSPYGYIPTEYVCAIFIGLFGLSALLHFGQAVRYRMWWLLPTAVLAGIAEVIGWSGRFWSAKNSGNIVPYLMQITTTIIAPTPLVAANFIILGRIIARLGSRYSRLSPKWYTIVFCTCDLISLVVQAVGGAGASEAAQQHRDASSGGNIMLGGIVFQMAAITVYVICAAEFFFRYYKDRPVRSGADQGQLPAGAPIGKHLKTMIMALGFNTTCLFIRSVYRTIELADGWSGRIITTQVYFNVLDGAMITLAIFTLNFFHPGRLLTEKSSPSYDVESKGHKNNESASSNEH